ncbi:MULTISPECIES: hypothetical protein [Undibacterium]|uniref:Uncharacterized protein n=1 Tax=Undibacterium umbellatum TaxID=2762300 RepID=A0ABR6Z5T2_9BURK|nr:MULTISPECIES: hypothetical protein [Undibacterium]MBC3907143.1 hypothetical protein [Undibacterium umbellatum]MDP1980702.1 hypothetical protein [Undibacterium sp.]
MIATKHLFLVAGLASWALMTAFGKKLYQEKNATKKLQKTEMSTWEGEGGNLPPKVSRPATDNTAAPQ